jgi:hypothetical protein
MSLETAADTARVSSATSISGWLDVLSILNSLSFGVRG